MACYVARQPCAVSPRSEPRVSRIPPLGSSYPLTDSKLQPPAPSPGAVPRQALVDRLLGAAAAPVVSIVAPPGYGKTTALRQWADQARRPVAWLSLDESDDDPTVLLTYTAAALDRVAPSDHGAALARPRPDAGGGVAHRVTALLATLNGCGGALVLDQAERLSNPRSREAVARMADGVPPGWQLAVVSRSESPLPLTRLRSLGRLVEIGVDDLRMDRREADALLAGVGVTLAVDDLDELVERTEGWPVALYLASLAARAGDPMRRAGFRFRGGDRFMADYFRSELLSQVSADTASFLTRTSALGQLSGPVCDAALGVEGSGPLLDWLDRSNLGLVPLDRQRDWYRYHHLLHDYLNAELGREEPALAASLRSRAATWFDAHAMPVAAIDHAKSAGDAARLARLVTRLALQVVGSKPVAAVEDALPWFEERGLVARYPALTILGGVTLTLHGDTARARRWAGPAESAIAGSALPDGSTAASWQAGLRALSSRDGVVAMRRDAEIARDGAAPSSAWRSWALLVEGVSYVLDDQGERADPILARATATAVQAGAWLVAALGLAEQAIVAVDRQDWMDAERLARRAVDVVGERGLDGCRHACLAYAVAAGVAMRHGDLPETRANLAATTRLRPALNEAVPALAVQALVELAWGAVALNDRPAARVALQEARDILQVRPDLGALPDKVASLRSKLGVDGGAGTGAGALTTAELRLVPMLSTHLTFREIGERLYLSRHTVKTQAMSVYRKVGASSRSEAIARMQDLGLVDGDRT